LPPRAPHRTVDCNAVSANYTTTREARYDTEAENLVSRRRNYREVYTCEDYAWTTTWADCMEGAETCEEANGCKDAACASDVECEG
jgi:hypothetical protein